MSEEKRRGQLPEEKRLKRSVLEKANAWREVCEEKCKMRCVSGDKRQKRSVSREAPEEKRLKRSPRRTAPEEKRLKRIA